MSKILAEIIADMQSAKQSIKVAVSWLTDPIIIDKMIEKRKSGIRIEIVTSADEWNILRFEKFQLLQSLGASVNKLGSADVFEPGFMHCKFYIIDDKIARGGSYNFTSNAASQFNQLNTINDPREFGETIKQFDQLFRDSVDFFTDIKQPEKIRAELEPMEKQGISPERRKEYELAVKSKRLEEEARVARLEKEKAEQEAKLAEEKAAKEKKERERVIAEQNAKEHQAQYQPKNDVKIAQVPPTSYGNYE
jgi:phosphatidylserine/phosphatidylglycerophosphate/cardiolipin synthase-like enzyme